MVFMKLAFKKILTRPFFAALAILFFTPSPEGLSQETISTEAELTISILSARDKDLYTRIFGLTEKGDWNAADKLISQLSDKILIGHVRFQRYMHPTKYRSTFSELSRWMSVYADHPGAKRIYRLARKRQGSASRPKSPEPIINGNGYSNGASPPSKKAVDTRKKADRKALARFDKRFDREI